MIQKYDIIGFQKVQNKITEPMTKFGGQPIWIDKAQWPISIGWENRKMMFVGQIYIDKNMFEFEKDFMAYIFVTHPKDSMDTFFDPDVTEWDGGENAVILQTFENVHIPDMEVEEGPCIFDEKNMRYEYIPILRQGYDPEFLTREEFCSLEIDQQDKYFTAIDSSKIGGTPNFFRGDAWPIGEWKLLLQLKCNFLPFELRLGGMPIMYVFIEKNLKKAGLLVQN